MPTSTPRPRVIAIVGSRRSTKYGEQIAYEAAYKLAKQGIIVVSGLAYGIDSCAHRGCVDAGGVSIAVLGTPIDQIYPQRNVGLAQRILDLGGAIISEYPSGTPVHAYQFAYRNRIVAGLADVVLIVEAAFKSGTMSTAEYANDQNKAVYAVPGDITHPMSVGCNQLIKNGAMVYTEPLDLMYDLGIRNNGAQSRQYDDCTPDEQKVIAAIQNGASLEEDILQTAAISPAMLAQCATTLQLKNIIKPVGDGEWALV